MTATYTKLRDGSWGIRATNAVAPGASISVTKKSGENKIENIGRVIWSGNGVWLATIEKSSNPKKVGSCDECGSKSNALREAADSSGVMGMVCPRCMRMSRYERSFA